MALDKDGLKSGIIELLTDMETRTEDAKEDFATELSNLIDDYVKSATIEYTSGLIAPSGGGTVTGTFVGSLS